MGEGKEGTEVCDMCVFVVNVCVCVSLCLDIDGGPRFHDD